jgi:hypothetical protein
MEEQEQYQAGRPEGKLIEIHTTKGVFLLYEHELIALLTSKPELWAQACKRGKFAVRRKKEGARRR